MKILISMISLMIASFSYGQGSTDIRPRQDLIPHSLQSYVDTRDCTAPIQSSPYVIVSGNGGANMDLSCPAEHPVMYGWRQQVGFGGIFSVQAGGGRSWITCCAVNHKWVPATVG